MIAFPCAPQNTTIVIACPPSNASTVPLYSTALANITISERLQGMSHGIIEYGLGVVREPSFLPFPRACVLLVVSMSFISPIHRDNLWS